MRSTEEKRAEVRRLEAEIAALHTEITASEAGVPAWPPKDYYLTYHILAGMVLGFLGAVVSLLFNVIGASMLNLHPLEIIRVYLTFPLGAAGLETEAGFALAAGCCLYLGTGMFGGIPFHLTLDRYFADAPFAKRFAVATVLALGVWVVNYYGLISWIQPMLTGGRWIIDKIPVYVAVATHLVFGWTMLFVDQWGRFDHSLARVPARSM